MRYIIYGAGGVGGVLGGRLFQAGHDVLLIARGAHLGALHAHGLTLRAPEGDVQLRVPAVGHPKEIAFTPDDVVILTMKTQDTTAALDDLEAVAPDDVPVICCQNGVANEPLAARRFRRVYGMVVLLPATFLEPGVVLGFGTPVSGVLDCGVYPRGTDALIERVAADINGAHFVSRAVADVMRLKYGKLLSNLENGVGAVTDAGSGNEATAAFMRHVRQEARDVYAAAAVDYATPEEFADRVRGHYSPGAIADAGRGGSSTWQSLARGHSRLETDYLNGEIVLLGVQHGVPAPYNAAARWLSQQVAARGGKPGEHTIADLETLAQRYAAPHPLPPLPSGRGDRTGSREG